MIHSPQAFHRLQATYPSAGGRFMRTPAQASFSATAIALALAISSVAFATPVRGQDSSLPPAAGPAFMQLAPEVQVSLTGFEADLNAAIGASDLRLQALALDRIGALYYAHGNIPEALKHFQEVLPIVRKLGEKTAEATALSDIGAANFALGRSEEALDAFKQALPIWRKVGNRDHEAATLGDIGEVFRALDDPVEALHFDQL